MACSTRSTPGSACTPALDNDYDGGWHQPRYLDAIGEKLQRRARDGASTSPSGCSGDEPDWDLFVTVLSESHSGGHHFWHGIDASHPLHDAFTAEQARRWLVRTYQSLDDGVGRLVAALPADTAVVVFAVHGMRANANDVTSLALLPELAHRLHFGESLLADVGQAAWKRRGYPPTPPTGTGHLARRRDQAVRCHASSERRRKRIRRALPDAPIAAGRRLQRRLTGRPRVAWDLNTIVPDRVGAVDRRDVGDHPRVCTGSRRSRYRRWWPQMDWFVLPTFSDAHVRINVAGRERDGRIPIDDFGEACDRFEETVRACINPRTGRSAVERVYRMREHPLEPNGPDGDLVVVWSDPADAIVHPSVGMVGPLPFQRTGEHSANGFAFVSGPGIDTVRRRHPVGVRRAADDPRPARQAGRRGCRRGGDRRRRPRFLMRVGTAPVPASTTYTSMLYAAVAEAGVEVEEITIRKLIRRPVRRDPPPLAGVVSVPTPVSDDGRPQHAVPRGVGLGSEARRQGRVDGTQPGHLTRAPRHATRTGSTECSPVSSTLVVSPTESGIGAAAPTLPAPLRYLDGCDSAGPSARSLSRLTARGRSPVSDSASLPMSTVATLLRQRASVQERARTDPRVPGDRRPDRPSCWSAGRPLRRCACGRRSRRPPTVTTVSGSTSGTSSDDDVQDYLRAADIVVLPYTESSNSFVALLALSFDRPILAPGIGAFPELAAIVGTAVGAALRG